MGQLFRTLRQLLGLDDSVTRRPFGEAGVLEQSAMEAKERRDAADLEFAESSKHSTPRVLAIDPLDDQLRDERVVERRDLRARGHPGVDPHPRPARLPIARDPPRAGQEAVGRVLRVDAALDRVPGHADVLLAQP